MRDTLVVLLGWWICWLRVPLQRVSKKKKSRVPAVHRGTSLSLRRGDGVPDAAATPPGTRVPCLCGVHGRRWTAITRPGGVGFRILEGQVWSNLFPFGGSLNFFLWGVQAFAQFLHTPSPTHPTFLPPTSQHLTPLAPAPSPELPCNILIGFFARLVVDDGGGFSTESSYAGL